LYKMGSMIIVFRVQQGRGLVGGRVSGRGSILGVEEHINLGCELSDYLVLRVDGGNGLGLFLLCLPNLFHECINLFHDMSEREGRRPAPAPCTLTLLPTQ